ncbi:GIY-YIG nuclease family protein [Candidatus Woesebacteria bacterium]|nr:GIY-YIG nuclease family protein [Candidatus Woesebacteria bacterium]
MNTIWFVYLLLCDQKTFYVGITTDVLKRISEHETKQSFFTKKFSDIRLVYCEKYLSEHEAAMREKQLKGWSHTKKQMLIEGKLGINSCTKLAEDLLRRRETKSQH